MALSVVQTIQPFVIQIQKCVDCDNFQFFMTEFGTITSSYTIYEHLQPFNSSGAMCALYDVNEYRKCVRSLNSSLVTQLFDTLHALCNLLLVNPENIQEVCTLVNFIYFINFMYNKAKI